MTVEIGGVFCNSCGQLLPDARPDAVDARSPCPACGSLSRLVKVYAHDELTFHTDLGLKKMTPGTGAMVGRRTQR